MLRGSSPEHLTKKRKKKSLSRVVLGIAFLLVTCCDPKSHVSAAGGEGREPRIVEHPESLVVPRGDPATLNCAAEGLPRPRVTWFRDGVEVTTSLQDPSNHRVLFPSGSLFFLSIKQGKKESDAGVYTCVATNANGRATSNNATLTIAVLREEFRTVPHDVAVASGERAEIPCVPPRGHPPPELSWTRNGHPIDPKEEAERVQIRDDGTLVIKEVLQTDEGEYVCHAYNPAGRRSSPAAILDVIVAPFWVKAPRDVVGVAGGEAELSCRVGGDPTPRVTWRRVDGRIPVGRVNVVRERGLRVSPLRPEDAGVYLCKASNRAAEITANASLIVLTAPRVEEVPGDVEVQEGAPLELSCAMEGSPAPLVYWTREGSQTVLPATRTPVESTSGTEEGLEGVRLTYSAPRAAHHHSGRYVCGGVNSAGGVMTRLGVRVRPAHLLPPPIISVPPTNQTLPLRGHAALTCRVWGSPPPTVTWRHRGRLVTPTSRRALLPDNTLTIDELSQDDAGEYACVASSPRGVTESKALLTVASPDDPDVVFVRAPDPDTAPGPPPTPTVRASNGTAALVEWEAPVRQGASPVIGYTLEYYSSSGAAWQVATALTPRTTFTLAPLDPASTYGVTVRAHNAHGISEPSGIAEVGGGGGWVQAGTAESGLQNAQVTLQDVTMTKPTSARILWQMTGEGINVEGFYIRLHHVPRDLQPSSAQATSPGARSRLKGPAPPPAARVGDASNVTVVTVLNAGVGASSYILDGLHHYRSYTVFLVPFFKTFEGHPSNSRTFQTPQAAPTAPPQNVEIQLTNVTSASVFWSPPPRLHRNGPITSYQIEVVSADGSVFLSESVNGSVMSLRVHNLTLGNSYHLSLAASTRAGRGPFTPPVSLHVDPVFLHPMAKSGPSLASLDGDVWVIGLIGAAVFCLLLVAVATLLLWRRHARNKALGHVGVSVHKVDNLGVGLGAGDASLWQEYAGWHLEKVCGGSTAIAGSTGGTLSEANDVKVMNTGGGVSECDNQPRSLITFYRGPTTTDGPYATTSLLAPHSLPHHQHKSHKDDLRTDGSTDKHSLGHSKPASERSIFTDGTNTLRRLKGNRAMLPAPPLPCLPPPGVPDTRSHTPCYCAGGSRGSHNLSESPYSEAHYAPTVSARHPCYHHNAPPATHTPHSQSAHSVCPSHVYASASPLPPYPESVASRPSLPSPGTSHHRLCRNSVVYESASLQYAPAGYYLPSSMASSFTSTTSEAPSGVSGSCGSERGVERGIQSSLPSLTYEAIKALGEDIEAFRQMHQLTDEESIKGGGGAGGGGGGVVGGTKTSASGVDPNHTSTGSGDRATSQPPPTFEVPAPPPTPPSTTTTTATHPPRTPTHAHTSAHLPNGPHAGTLAPGGSLPPLEIGAAPLGEGESDCQEEEVEEEEDCSGCSCSCSEAESSVYAETEFADEVRASLQEPGRMGATENGGRGRRHRHKRRPASTYSTDSNYTQLPDPPTHPDVMSYKRPTFHTGSHSASPSRTTDSQRGDAAP